MIPFTPAVSFTEKNYIVPPDHLMSSLRRTRLREFKDNDDKAKLCNAGVNMDAIMVTVSYLASLKIRFDDVDVGFSLFDNICMVELSSNSSITE